MTRYPRTKLATWTADEILFPVTNDGFTIFYARAPIS